MENNKIVFEGTPTCTCDLSKEREFLENLLNQRFNFFLVLFALVIGGAINARSQQHFFLVFAVGALVCWLVAMTIFRAQYKFDILFKQLPATHPAIVVDGMAKGMSMRKLIGYVIPVFCCSLLTLAAILASEVVFKVP